MKTKIEKSHRESRTIRLNQERILDGPIRALTTDVTELVHAARDMITAYAKRSSVPREITALQSAVEPFKHLD
jgi:hypothetical protein